MRLFSCFPCRRRARVCVHMCEWMFLFMTLTWIKRGARIRYVTPYLKYSVCSHRCTVYTLGRWVLSVKCYEHASLTSHAFFPFLVVSFQITNTEYRNEMCLFAHAAVAAAIVIFNLLRVAADSEWFGFSAREIVTNGVGVRVSMRMVLCWMCLIRFDAGYNSCMW